MKQSFFFIIKDCCEDSPSTLFPNANPIWKGILWKAIFFWYLQNSFTHVQWKPYKQFDYEMMWPPHLTPILQMLSARGGSGERGQIQLWCFFKLSPQPTPVNNYLLGTTPHSRPPWVLCKSCSRNSEWPLLTMRAGSRLGLPFLPACSAAQCLCFF